MSGDRLDFMAALASLGELPRTCIANAMRRAVGEASLIDRLPVDPFAIANDRDIIVEAKPDAEPSISGMLSATNRLRRKILHLAFVARSSRVRG